MNCPKCGGPASHAAERCLYCGAVLDAPVAATELDALIEQKARAVLQQERDAAAALRSRDEARSSLLGVLSARSARLSAEARRQDAAKAELAKARVSLGDMQRRLERANAERPGLLRLTWPLAVFAAIVACLVGGIILPACIEPLMGRSLVAAQLLCPGECDGCRGPGRIFTWHESSSGYEGNVSTQLCHNRMVDVDALPWMEVSSHEDDSLKPYRLTMWASVPLDAGIVFVATMLVVPVLAGRGRRRTVARQRVTYAEAVERLEATIAAMEKAPSHRDH